MKAFRTRRPRHGAALLEFALWILPLLIVLTGVIELSRMMSLKHQISRAARDGARVGAGVLRNAAGNGVPTEPDIENTATNHALQVLTDLDLGCPAGCNVWSEWYDSATGRKLLRVRVQYPYVPLVGLYPLATSVERDFSMATEYQP